jgi:predicted Zn-dependent peptidase
MIGYKGISFKHADEAALNILASILSRGESSRLYRGLVYEKQIAASVSASNDSRLDPGLFTFYAQARPGKTAAECEKAIYATLHAIKKGGVTDREVQKAKNGIRADYLNGFKTNMGRAGMLSEYEANWGTWKELLNYVPKHEKVTADDIKRVANKYFNERKRTVVTLHPEKTADSGISRKAAEIPRSTAAAARGSAS